MNRTAFVRPAVALTALIVTATAVGTAPAAAEPPPPPEPAGEFVISFAEGFEGAALRAARQAGATVVDVNEALNIALVAAGGDFVAEVADAAAVTGVARNHSVGTSLPGMPHRFAEERPSEADRAAAVDRANPPRRPSRRPRAEPLADLQWDMTMMGVERAHRRATGRGVTVGIIDTGIDASHPDIAPNFNRRLSRNFTMDIPAVDGPCEVPTCIDPPGVDDNGHGTHVAGIVAAADNGLGIGGVAPDATIVNVRAGQDSGFFFVYETVAALTYAGDAGLDVVNMSFYTDPWLYNCASRDDYISGDVTDEEIAEQAFIRQVVLAGLDYAHENGVTLVGSAGNSHFNLALAERFDATSPDYPPGSERERVVTDNCLDLPSEGPDVISVSAVGPSTTKADYSNYGLGDVEVSAPGGWFRDYFGTPEHRVPGNLILSSYPLDVAIETGLADENGQPVDGFSVVNCKAGVCGFYTYLQGTSMASPHVAGVAALVVEEYGRGNARRGYSLDPEIVRVIIERTAVDHACPVGGVEDYSDEGRDPAEYNAVCEGTTADNGLYGEGIVSASRAVGRRR